MRQKGTPNRVYTPEFKIEVVETMRKERLGLFETISRFSISDNPHNAKKMVRRWERIYLEEGVRGLMIDKRGRSWANIKNPQMPDKVREDLIDENQRLRVENEYLKQYAESLAKLKTEKI